MKSADSSLRYKITQIIAHHDVLRSRVPFLRKRYIRSFRKAQLEAARNLRDKERIEVAFFLTVPGMWKCDYLMRRMQQDARFHPYVVIYPYSQYKGFSKRELETTLRRTESFVASKGFEYVIPYDEKRHRWKDVRKVLKPDIVVLSDPYKDCLPKYYIYHFKHTLTCYVPYSLTHLRIYRENYMVMPINLVALFCLETPKHMEFALKYMHNGAENAVVTGYPGSEVFMAKDYVPKNVWKPQPYPNLTPTQPAPAQLSTLNSQHSTPPKKRVIWAPHHSIDDAVSIASFLDYCDGMVALAHRYEGQIQFAFKPHQLLKFKLQKLWGEERTEAYYNTWRDMPNGQLEETSYVDLFLTSDAMVHDSASFTTEYLYTHRPVMYLVKDDRMRQSFTPYGEIVFDAHYHAHSIDDVERFLTDVVLGGKDPMEAQRREVYERYLQPVDGMLPSEKIIHELEKLINND